MVFFSVLWSFPSVLGLSEKPALVTTQAHNDTGCRLVRPDEEKYLLLIFSGLVSKGKLFIILNRAAEQNIYTFPELTSLQLPPSYESIQLFTLFGI